MKYAIKSQEFSPHSLLPVRRTRKAIQIGNKMIVPFPAGGPSDIVARIAAEGMRKHLGQNIVIENVGAPAARLAQRCV